MGLLSFNASMLREKFVIRDLTKPDSEEMVVTSNRLDIPLLNDAGEIIDNVIIRSKFMHHALRMAGFVLKEFEARGPFTNRTESIEFDESWGKLLSKYDKTFEKESWVALFIKGRCIYNSTKLHPFLDVIEQCDVKNPDDYDFSVAMAEEAFQKAGRDVKIDYSGTLGMVSTFKPGTGRCGLIFRNPNDTTTFNFMAENQDKEEAAQIQPLHLILTAADFLEQIQLSFVIGFIEAKIEKRKLLEGEDQEASEEKSKEEAEESKKAKRAHERISQLDDSIDVFEKTFNVRYRPEKPAYKNVINQSKSRAKSLIT